MQEADQPRFFDSEDVGLLEAVLDLVPDLDIVAYAAKLARERVTYPIDDHSGLLPLFSGQDGVIFKDRQITFEQAVRFIPREFFPIESERDFLCRLLIVFQRGRIFHQQEDFCEQMASTLTPTDELNLLPSPTLAPFGKVLM